MKIRPRKNDPWGFTALLFCLMVLALAIACGGGSEEPAAETEAEAETMEEPMEEAAAEEMSGPRIFFVKPEAGSTVTSPVSFEFGIEGLELAPKLTYEPGTGHHHIGITDTCVPAGEAIPEADPWVHMGDASFVIDMQLPPGEHTLTIQLGNGDHIAFEDPGLCKSITINVAES